MNGTLQSLLKSYQQEPGFPFIDWTTNHHSFFRLINFWDEVFQISAGEKITDYVAAQKVTQDSFSPILFVRNANETKKFVFGMGSLPMANRTSHFSGVAIPT